MFKEVNSSLSYWGGNTRTFFGVIIATLFINVLSLALPITLTQIYDRIIPNHAIQTLLLLTVGVFIALIIEMMLRFSREVINQWADARLEHTLSNEMYRKLLNVDLSKVKRYTPNDYFETMQTLSLYKNYFSTHLLVAYIDTVFIVVFLGVIYYIAGFLFLVPLVVVGMFTLFLKMSHAPLKDPLTQKYEANDKRLRFLSNIFDNIHALKSMSMEKLIARRHDRLLKNTLEIEHEVSTLGSQSQTLLILATQISIIVVVICGAMMITQKMLTIGSLAACIILVGRILQPLNRLDLIWRKNIILGVLGKKIEKIKTLSFESPSGTEIAMPVRGDIACRNLAISGEIDNEVVLNNINFEVKQGEIIGIYGSNSSGGIRDLLLSFIKMHSISAGEIFIGGKDIEQYQSTVLSNAISYIPSQAVIFRGTVIDNMTMHDHTMDDVVIDISKKMGLHRTITHLPGGYETNLGESVTNVLSRGVEQRICLVRAFSRSSEIILFDNADNFLDNVSRKNLLHYMSTLKGKKTMVIYSHSADMYSIADRSITL